jgi:hypothetical protein
MSVSLLLFLRVRQIHVFSLGRRANFYTCAKDYIRFTFLCDTVLVRTDNFTLFDFIECCSDVNLQLVTPCT